MTEVNQPYIEDNTMKTPNIFDFATSELSQDAVLAYILAWADPECDLKSKNYPKLKKLGLDFLNALLDKAGRPVQKITELCVATQDNRVDISVKINDSIFLIIEDKTNTGAHSDQIKNYVEEAKNSNRGEEILSIYLKTGNESKCYLPEISLDGVDGHFFRNDLLDVLKKNPDTSNDIVEEFRQHLKQWERDTESFLKKPCDKWTWCAYEGYYLALEKELGSGSLGWEYVPNQSGGLFGFWWDDGDSVGDCAVKLQIHHDKGLFIRASRGEKIPTSSLWKLLEKAEKCAESIKGIHVEKPNRYHPGKSANAARIYFDGDISDRNNGHYYLAKNQEGKIDLAATVKRIKTAKKLLLAMCK